MKIEQDHVEVLSGIRQGITLGSPIALMIENRDFVHWQDTMSPSPSDDPPSNPRVVTRPRPGHADLAGGLKYGASTSETSLSELRLARPLLELPLEPSRNSSSPLSASRYSATSPSSEAFRLSRPRPLGTTSDRSRMTRL